MVSFELFLEFNARYGVGMVGGQATLLKAHCDDLLD